MKNTFAAILAFSATVIAVPTGSTSSCSNTQQNANFDDLTGVPGVANPLPVPYKGLYYQGFQYLPIVQTNAAPGVIPHSGTRYAISSLVQTTTAGSAELTVQYQNSNVKSFTLQSFYFGCALFLENGATALPAACNIAVTAYASGDDTTSTVQVGAQTFSYNPSTTTGVQQMAFGSFISSFKNLQYVLIQYSVPGGAAATQSLLGLTIDDVKYTTCS